MPVSEEWANKATRQLRSQRAGISKMRDRTTRQIQKVEAALEGLRELEAGLSDRVRRYGDALANLDLMREDPAVLVRSTGTGSYAYHSAQNPCGWVRDQSHYESMLWGEARAQGMQPCSSCGYRADRLAHQSARRQTQGAEAG